MPRPLPLPSLLGQESRDGGGMKISLGLSDVSGNQPINAQLNMCVRMVQIQLVARIKPLHKPSPPHPFRYSCTHTFYLSENTLGNVKSVVFCVWFNICRIGFIRLKLYNAHSSQLHSGELPFNCHIITTLNYFPIN